MGAGLLVAGVVWFLLDKVLGPPPLPDIGHPFDVEAYYPEPIAPEDDALPLYVSAARMTPSVDVPFSESDIAAAVQPLASSSRGHRNHSDLTPILEDPERAAALQWIILDQFGVRLSLEELRERGCTTESLYTLVSDRYWYGTLDRVPPWVAEWFARYESPLARWREGARRERAILSDPRVAGAPGNAAAHWELLRGCFKKAAILVNGPCSLS